MSYGKYILHKYNDVYKTIISYPYSICEVLSGGKCETRTGVETLKCFEKCDALSTDNYRLLISSFTDEDDIDSFHECPYKKIYLSRLLLNDSSIETPCKYMDIIDILIVSLFTNKYIENKETFVVLSHIFSNNSIDKFDFDSNCIYQEFKKNYSSENYTMEQFENNEIGVLIIQSVNLIIEYNAINDIGKSEDTYWLFIQNGIRSHFGRVGSKTDFPNCK